MMERGSSEDMEEHLLEPDMRKQFAEKGTFLAKRGIPNCLLRALMVAGIVSLTRHQKSFGSLGNSLLLAPSKPEANAKWPSDTKWSLWWKSEKLPILDFQYLL